MTKKGIYKLVTKPHIFLKDYMKKNKEAKRKLKIYVEKVIDINIPFHSYYYGLFLVLNKGKFFHLAEKSLKRAIGLKAKAIYHYQLGVILKRKNQWWQIVDSISKAIEMNPSADIKWHLAYAEALEKMNRFEEASFVLEKFAQDNKLDSDWYFTYGYLLEKASKKKQAQIAFSKAIELDTDKNSKKLGIGIFYEEKGLWIEALEVYKKEVEKQPENALIYYKLGLSYDRCYDWENAEVSFVKALTLDTTDAHWFYRLGFVRERQEKWKEAEEAYRFALERQENFYPSWYYRLGYVLEKQGKYKESTKAFKEQRILQDAHGITEARYNKNNGLKKIVNYTEYYERHEVEDKTILYESYHGRSISCNPYALFKEIYNDERFSEYKHIWAINNMDVIPKSLKSDVNIIFVKIESDLYLRYLTKAKYLINNTSFSNYFIRKEKQIYLNTWHGTPVKLMGKDAKDEFLSHKNITRNFLHTSHLIHPNRYTLDIMLESYDIKNIYEGVIAEIGYPRQDLMINISKDDKEKLFEQLKIDKDKKVVLYAPTWRGTGVSDVEFDKEKLLKDLNLLSQLENVQLLYRGHYMAEKFIQEVPTLQDMIVPSSIDTNSLLSIVDVLITDYSSIAFDFMALEKPIIYYAYDQDEYQNERGLKFDLEEISENVCKDNQQLSTLLEKVVKNPTLDKKQIKAQEKFCAYDDGNASKRVVDLLFFNKKDKKYIVEFEKKESILFYGGPFIPNGITTSFLSLTSKINQDKFNITIVLEPNLIINNEQRLGQLSRLTNNINILARFGKMPITLEEKWIIDKLSSQNILTSNEMWTILYKSYRRDFLRVFGHVKFTNIINFEGYNSYWVRLLSPVAESNNSIYLHNEMLGEAETRFPSLYTNFQLYDKYNNLISVSTDVDNINKINLADAYMLPLDKFKQCDNLLNPQEVLAKSEENLELKSDEKFFNDDKIFINMARLSPEKDQEKLIYAFSKIIKKHKNSKLLILGQGPLKNNLETLIKKLSMNKNIFILGQRFNPMPYLKRMDCFVLSSNYEGQGLVLLEAMILGEPVISTDIVGPRSVLEGKPGLLVENSEDGLYNGMLDFLEGRYKEDKKFDYEEYNQNALNMFYEKVLKKGE